MSADDGKTPPADASDARDGSAAPGAGVDASAPASRSPRPTLVYDGDCAFCRAQIARIQRLDPGDSFAYMPSQAPDLLARFPMLAGSEMSSGLRFVSPEGAVRVGADAVYEIARRLPGWRWLAWLYRVPGLHALARGVYAWIAARRHALRGACPDDTCRR